MDFGLGTHLLYMNSEFQHMKSHATMTSSTRRLLEVEKKPTIISSHFKSYSTALIDSTYIIEFHNLPDSTASELSPDQQAHAVEGDPDPSSFPIKSHHGSAIDYSSIIDFHTLPEPDLVTPGVASESHNAYRDAYQEPNYQFYRHYLQKALYSLIDEDPEGCQRRCKRFIKAKFVPDVLKVEALQLLATIVSLPQALQYLGTATNIIIPYKNADPRNLMWKGMFITTRDMLLRINNIGNKKVFHDTTVYPNAGARERDMKKCEPGSKQVRFSEEDTIKEIEVKNMRPYKTYQPASTLNKPLRIRGAWDRSYTVGEDFKPKFACQPLL